LDQRRAFATRGTGQRSIVVCTSDQPSGRRDASEAAHQTAQAIIARTETGVTETLWSVPDLVTLLEEHEAEAAA